ncbi:FAD-dependent oxidoreductase, partial [Peribacillus sp. SIMBA_075]
EVSKELARLLKKRKVTIVTGAKVLPESLEKGEGRVVIQAETQTGVQSFEAEKVLVSVGRQANVENLGLEATEIKVERGAVVVNE